MLGSKTVTLGPKSGSIAWIRPPGPTEKKQQRKNRGGILIGENVSAGSCEGSISKSLSHPARTCGEAHFHESAGPESCIYETGKATWPVVDLTEIVFVKRMIPHKKGASPESCTIIELEGHSSLGWSWSA